MVNTRRKKRVYKEEFKLQMVQLVNSGKSRKDVINEYDLTPSTLDKWIKNYCSSKSFKVSDNLTKQEIELIDAKKQIKQLKMEVDILKQATLIIGRKP